ncbi:hypothetical protein [Dysgonomonas capnocytophagoides]|uniref:hypothetical protein n=1 Tax=Dysgonomonas capnocytophagoides TaxID=45254 RepID=UPI0029229469|nr:hypothetical protein DCPSUM001_33560 [Dysgonomonas capnocytophagoides]
MRTETVKDIIELFDNADIMMAYHDMLCGNLIGEGCSRIVYQCDYDESCVVKIHKKVDRLPSDNILEWELWQMVKDMTNDVPKWFAPCVRISENGRVLIQKKTAPLTDNQWYNLKETPTYLSDIKRSNLGIYKGHICTHDYAFSLYRLKIDNSMRKISKENKIRP